MKNACPMLVFAAVLGTALAMPGGQAHAYETDQLTGRQLTPPDASPMIDAYVSAALERAREKAEKKLEHGGDADKVLRAEIIAQFPMDPLYFGAPIEKWLGEVVGREGYAVEPDGPGTGWGRNIYDKYDSLYAMNPLQDLPTPAMVFGIARHVAGTYIAPTFVTASGIRYGADKWSHFFRLGYRYWLRSGGGKDKAAALAYGTHTERGEVGYATSGALSFGDLAANYQGYRFYLSVLGGDHPYFEVRDGRITQVREFHSSEYIIEDWDEYLNPCIYRPHVLVAVQKHLHEDKARVCAEYAQWRDTYSTPRSPLMPKSEYVDVANVPAQTDPFRLGELCSER